MNAEADNASGLTAFIREAKRRQVFRMAGIYAAGAFVLLQLADILFPGLGIPESAIAPLLVVIAAGFPIALALAWLFEWGPDGLKLTSSLGGAESGSLPRGRVLDAILVLMALGVGALYLERLLPAEDAPAPDRGSRTTAGG